MSFASHYVPIFHAHVDRAAPFIVVGAICAVLTLANENIAAGANPVPTHADVSYGPNPNQLIDIYLPSQGSGPYPVVVWFGGLWKPSKHPARLDFFLPNECAVIAVQLRTMTEAMADKVAEPVSYVMND